MKQSSENYPEISVYGNKEIEYYIHKGRQMRAEYLGNMVKGIGRAMVKFLRDGKRAPVRRSGPTVPV